MQTIWNQALPSSSAIHYGALAPRTKHIYVGNPLQHYSYEPFGQPKMLTPPRSKTTMIKLSCNERFLALASDIVDLMDLERGKVVRQFTDHTNSITAVCNERNSPHIWASVGMDRTMRIFDSRQHPGQITCFRSNFRHRCLTYSPDSAMLFCGGENILVFDVRKNLEYTSIKTVNQVLDIECHPLDCVILSCTDDRMVKVWDIDTKECLSQSFPLESQPQKVLFHGAGSVLLACTSEKLYTCSWEQFEVISQHSWSTSKQPSKFMVMTGESRNPPSVANLNGPVKTLDMEILDGMVMHLGVSGSSKLGQSLDLRSVAVERLLTPQTDDDSVVLHDTAFILSDDGALDDAFLPLCSSTLIQEKDDLDSAIIPSPLILSPTKTTPALIRKLPRSTSSSRSNLSKVASSATQTPAAPVMSTPINRRSSSSNALHHAAEERTNSTRKLDKKDPPPSLPLLRSRQSPALQSEAKKPLSRRRSSRGPVTFADMIGSSGDFISMMSNRQAGVQRVKAVMKSRSNNEDEVFAEAISLSDKSAFVRLLEQLSSKSIGLKLAARILPELRFLLSHENSNFVDAALKVLDEIVTQLIEAILQGLSSNAQSIGVDVAAEQRQKLCKKCKDALLEIYVNLHFLTAKFNEEQLLYFHSTVQKYADLVS